MCLVESTHYINKDVKVISDAKYAFAASLTRVFLYFWGPLHSSGA